MAGSKWLEVEDAILRAAVREHIHPDMVRIAGRSPDACRNRVSNLGLNWVYPRKEPDIKGRRDGQVRRREYLAKRHVSVS